MKKKKKILPSTWYTPSSFRAHRIVFEQVHSTQHACEHPNVHCRYVGHPHSHTVHLIHTARHVHSNCVCTYRTHCVAINTHTHTNTPAAAASDCSVCCAVRVCVVHAFKVLVLARQIFPETFTAMTGAHTRRQLLRCIATLAGCGVRSAADGQHIRCDRSNGPRGPTAMRAPTYDGRGALTARKENVCAATFYFLCVCVCWWRCVASVNVL